MSKLSNPIKLGSHLLAQTDDGILTSAEVVYDETREQSLQTTLDSLVENEVSVDGALSSTSTNPVQNKVINSALAEKADSEDVYTKTEIDTKVSAINSNKQDVASKVTSLSANSTDTQYPSAKAVVNYVTTHAGDTQIQSDWTQTDNSSKDFIKNKPEVYSKSEVDSLFEERAQEIILDIDGVENLENKVTTLSQYNTNEQYPSAKAVVDYVLAHSGEEGGGGIDQVQADWDETDNTKVEFIKNKPELADVAISGAYSDLTGTPDLTGYLDADDEANIWDSIHSKADSDSVYTKAEVDNLLEEAGGSGVEQIQSDWNQTDTSAKDYIKNKPTIPSIAGLENASNKVTSLSSSSTDTQYPSAKCVYDQISTYGSIISDQGRSIQYLNSTLNDVEDSVFSKEATSNKVTSLSSSSTDTQYPSAKAVVDYVAVHSGGGSGIDQVQSDWNQIDNTSVDYIKNKPDLSLYYKKTEVDSLIASMTSTIAALTARIEALEAGSPITPSEDRIFDDTFDETFD